MEYKINDKVYNISSNLTDFQIKLYTHLIDWKHKHITKEPGIYKGNLYDLMFPESYSKNNEISPVIYDKIHSEIKEIQKSPFAYKVHKMAFHMASSQCACINLFLPILLDSKANEIISKIPGYPCDFDKIDRSKLYKGFCFEYWGQDITSGKGLLNDHSNVAGTDADIAIAYLNKEGESCLWLIEHKLTETDFTNCGGYKSKNNKSKESCKNSNLDDILCNPELCHYHQIGYNYWSIQQSKNYLFNAPINSKGCPFLNGVNQLWRNQLLAFALENTPKYTHVSFSVVHHKDNTSLQPTIHKYKQLITNNITFTTFTNSDIINSAETYSNELSEWITWYKDLYNL